MFYSACIPAIFGSPVHQALSSVYNAGLDHYEFWSWWDQDMDACLEVQEKYHLIPAAMCTRMVPLVDPTCRDDYLQGLEETVAVCRKLGCKTIISQVGQELAGVPRQAQHESIVDGLRRCVPLLRRSGMTLVFEPLNTRFDHKGYYLWQAGEAFQIVEEVGDCHVKVLMDLYHQYAMDDLQLPEILENLDKIGHFHMAGFPGRHEPLIHCEIDYPTILRAIRQGGFSGGVGLEYFPLGHRAQGLKELYQQLLSL